MKPIIINIHGSCVSRDLFRGQEDSPLVVGEYIARSTIFSTMAAPVKISDPSFHEKGTWRKRLVQMDCGKKLFDCFREHPSDILLLDGIDERLGVLTFGGGAALTMSPYAQQELPAPVLAGGGGTRLSVADKPAGDAKMRAGICAAAA